MAQRGAVWSVAQYVVLEIKTEFFCNEDAQVCAINHFCLVCILFKGLCIQVGMLNDRFRLVRYDFGWI